MVYAKLIVFVISAIAMDAHQSRRCRRSSPPTGYRKGLGTHLAPNPLLPPRFRQLRNIRIQRRRLPTLRQETQRCDRRESPRFPAFEPHRSHRRKSRWFKLTSRVRNPDLEPDHFSGPAVSFQLHGWEQSRVLLYRCLFFLLRDLLFDFRELAPG